MFTQMLFIRKVVETMDSGGYTYVCLEKKGKKTWVAVPQMKVKGAEHVFSARLHRDGKLQEQNLNRTFDRVIFSGGR